MRAAGSDGCAGPPLCQNIGVGRGARPAGLRGSGSEPSRAEPSRAEPPSRRSGVPRAPPAARPRGPAVREPPLGRGAQLGAMPLGYGLSYMGSAMGSALGSQRCPAARPRLSGGGSAAFKEQLVRDYLIKPTGS